MYMYIYTYVYRILGQSLHLLSTIVYDSPPAECWTVIFRTNRKQYKVKYIIKPKLGENNSVRSRDKSESIVTANGC